MLAQKIQDDHLTRAMMPNTASNNVTQRQGLLYSGMAVTFHASVRAMGISTDVIYFSVHHSLRGVDSMPRVQ